MGFCTNCGVELQSGTKFCSNCGEKYSDSTMASLPQTGQDSTAVITDEDFIAAYITGKPAVIKPYDKKSLRFITVFKKFESSDTKTNWNLPACLWGEEYLAYRKEYTKAVLLFLGRLILIPSGKFFGLINVLLLIVLGLFSDYFLYRRFKRKQSEAQLLYPESPKKQLEAIAQSGGVNKGLVIVFILLHITAIIITIAALSIYLNTIGEILDSLSTL